MSATAVMAALAIITFVSLLCVDKYIMPTTNRQTHTVQLQVNDVFFFRHSLVVPNLTQQLTMLGPRRVVLRISNQKNGPYRETTYHHVLPDRRISVVITPVHHVATGMRTTGYEQSLIFLLGTPDNSAGHITQDGMDVSEGGRLLPRPLSSRNQGY